VRLHAAVNKINHLIKRSGKSLSSKSNLLIKQATRFTFGHITNLQLKRFFVMAYQIIDLQPKESIFTDGRSSLPIDGVLEQVLALLEKGQVLLFTGETGSGKSSRLGPGMFQLWEDKIYHCLPKRNLVRWLANHVAKENKTSLGGNLVGYHLAREQQRSGENTQLVYMVDQSLLNRIVRERALPEGIIIVDEVHERSAAIDILIGLIKKWGKNCPNTAVIVTTATPDEEIAEFLNLPYYRVKGRCFPVRVNPFILGKGEPHSFGCEKATIKLMTQFVNGTLVLPSESNEEQIRYMKSGSVAIILPGKEDIRTVQDQLQEYARNQGITNRFEFMSIHSQVDAHEQDAVLAPVPDGVMRIILGTEVIRAGATIPSLRVIVDSLRKKRLYCDPKGITHLTTLPISASEATQAEGRIGRVDTGIYIPVGTKGEYGDLSKSSLAELVYSDPSSAVLKMASLGFRLEGSPEPTEPLADGSKMEILELPVKIPEEKVRAATELLIKFGALDPLTHMITPLGVQLEGIPLSPSAAMNLIAADKRGVLPEAVILEASLETEGFFAKPADTGSITLSNELGKVLLNYLRPENPQWTLRKIASVPKKYDLDCNLSEIPPWIKKDEDSFVLLKSSYLFPDKSEFERVLRSEIPDRVDSLGVMKILACFKKEYASWKMNDSPIERAQIESNLPKWIQKNSRDDWDVDLIEANLDLNWVARLARLRWSEIEMCSVIAAYRAYRSELSRLQDLQRRHRGDTQNFVSTKLNFWAQENLINLRRMKMCDGVVATICEDLANTNLDIRISMVEADRKYSQEQLLKAFILSHPDNLGRKAENRRYVGPAGEFQLGSRSACQTAQYVIAGFFTRIPTKKLSTLITISEFAAPVEPSWLSEVAPQMMQTEYVGHASYDVALDGVVQTRVDRFNNFEIARYQDLCPDVNEARRTLVRWVMQNLALDPDKSPNPGLFKLLNGLDERNNLARRLNIKSGESFLPVVIGEDLVSFLESLIPGRRLATIEIRGDQNIELLDQELVDLIQYEYPDTLKIGSVVFTLEYRENQNSRILLTSDMVKNHVWNEMDFSDAVDGELHLPGGAVVEIGIEWSKWKTARYYTNTTDLKNEIQSKLEENSFDSWTRPEWNGSSASASYVSGQEKIPEVSEVQFGFREFTNETLLAYGAPSFVGDQTVSIRWFRDRQSACQCHGDFTAQILQKTEFEKIKAQEEAQRLERRNLVDQGYALSDFEAVLDRANHGSYCQTFVILQNGKLQPSDRHRICYDRSSSYHFETWSYIGPDALVIQWTSSSEGHWVDNASFKVLKKPCYSYSVTSQQHDKLQFIETVALGLCPGVFEIDASTVEFHENLVSSLQDLFALDPVTGEPFEWSRSFLYSLYAERILGSGSEVEGLLPPRAAFERDYYKDGQNGYPMHKEQIGDEIFEFVVIFQNDEYSLIFRARKVKKGEKIIKVASSDGVVDNDALKEMLRKSGLKVSERAKKKK
jgi:HrpA-like RNA helicase